VAVDERVLADAVQAAESLRWREARQLLKDSDPRRSTIPKVP